MTAALPALAGGAALAVFATALHTGLAVLFWPQAALAVIMLGVVAGGLAGLGVAAAPERWRALVRRRAALLAGLAALAGLASFPAIAMIAVELHPGPALLAFPPHVLLLCASPFVIAASVLVSRLGTDGPGCVGWLAVGAAAGCLAAAAIGGLDLPLRTPWFGGHDVQFAPAGDGSTRVIVDRGLREYVIAPAPPRSLLYLPYLPARDAGGVIDVLFVGWPQGRTLAALLAEPQVRLTVLEEDAALVAGVLRRWPALAAARDAGRARFVVGNPRWSLERLEGRFGLIALHDGATSGAYLSRALNLRADHRWTLEAFRSYLARLAPSGFLLVERTATGRVVATLREATGLPPHELLHTLVILGPKGRYSSQCWFRLEGLSDPVLRGMAVAAVRSGVPAIYIPTTRATGTFYDQLIRGERVKGQHFSTPLDLSPALDERPFFDDVDRLAISPLGRSLPEEADLPAGRSPLIVVPRGDRGAVGLLVFGALAALAIVALLRRPSEGRTGRACAGRVAAPALALGSCAALTLEGFAAWARWLSPSAEAALAAIAAMLLGAGAGWLGLKRPAARALPLALGAALSLAAFAAYRAPAGALPPGLFGSALSVAAAGALLGLPLGGSLRATACEVDRRVAGSAAWFGGVALIAAALAWPAARLAATHFGYRLIWALGAVAALAAARSLRDLPEAPPGKSPT